MWPGLLAVAAASLSVAGTPAKTVPDESEVLETLGRVAGLYRDQALQFTCNETIVYEQMGDEHPSTLRFRYVYRRSDDGDALFDVRRPRGGSREPPGEDRNVDLEDHDLPAYLLRAYSWAFVFDPSARGRFDFEIEGYERIAGRRVLRIRFEGRPPFREGINDWVGHAWIDPRSYQLLRIRAVKADESEAEALYRQAKAHRAPPGMDLSDLAFTTFTTSFRVAKNGMRFPSRVVIERRAFSVREGLRGELQLEELSLYNVSQTYSRYRFYEIRTRTEIGRIVEGASVVEPAE